MAAVLLEPAAPGRLSPSDQRLHDVQREARERWQVPGGARHDLYRTSMAWVGPYRRPYCAPEQLGLPIGDLDEKQAAQQGDGGRSTYPPVVKTRLTGVGTSATLPVGVSSPVC